MFVAEDGTGLSTANSLATLAFATDWWSMRAAPAAWSGGNNTAREKWLVQATDYLMRRYRFIGSKKSASQALPWPREGAAERDGQAIESTVVPGLVKQATAYLAGLIASGFNPTPVLSRGGAIKTETVGPLSTTYMDSAAQETAVLYVDGLLFPVLSAAGIADTSAARRLGFPDGAGLPDLSATEIPPAFDDGAFTINGGGI